MAKEETIDVTKLASKEISELRLIAKQVGLKNYLKSTAEDLIERIIEAVEFEEEEEEESEEEQEESSEEEEEPDSESEEEEEEVSETEEEESEEEEKEEAPAKKASSKTTKSDKKAEKPAKPAKKVKDASETSKSEKVRVIVRELIESGKSFTSGMVMIQLESRHNQQIHRSFVSAVIAAVRKEMGVPAPVREKKVAEPVVPKKTEKKKDKE